MLEFEAMTLVPFDTRLLDTRLMERGGAGTGSTAITSVWPQRWARCWTGRQGMVGSGQRGPLAPEHCR